MTPNPQVRFKLASSYSGRVLKHVYEDGQELESPEEKYPHSFIHHKIPPSHLEVEQLCGFEDTHGDQQGWFDHCVVEQGTAVSLVEISMPIPEENTGCGHGTPGCRACVAALKLFLVKEVVLFEMMGKIRSFQVGDFLHTYLISTAGRKAEEADPKHGSC